MGEPGPETTGEAGEEGRVADDGLAGASSDGAAEGDDVGEGSQQPDNEEDRAVRNEEICAQCGTDVAKYRCPRCNIRTCSAGCVKAHKDDTGCTGKRDRTAYVSLREFDDRQLGSGKTTGRHSYLFCCCLCRRYAGAGSAAPPKALKCSLRASGTSRRPCMQV